MSRSTITRPPSSVDDAPPVISTPLGEVEHPAREESLARRAYELYEQRGGEDGHDWEDWFQAERDIRER